jgi:NADH-quinone oxidoreductase subunit L
VDEIYQAVFVDSLVSLANTFWAFWDVIVIDGFVNSCGYVARALGEGLRKIQTGRVQGYALTILFGAVLLAVYWAVVAAF